MQTLHLQTASVFELTDTLLLKLSTQNSHLKMERDAEGNLIIMSPCGTRTSIFQAEITGQLRNWNRIKRSGVVSESQAGFTLPDGSVRSPDAAWVSAEKWNALSDKQKEGFAPVCPEFIVEVLSPSDSLPEHFKKMEMWISQGVVLGLLIDPTSQSYWVYRPGETAQAHPFSLPFSGDPVLSGFVLDVNIAL